MSKDVPRMDSPLRATLAGIRDVFSRGVRRELGEHERLDGKNVLLTGGNRGLGRGIATRLAERGATLILALRDPEDPAVEALREQTDHAFVTALPLDLEDPRSPPALVQALNERDLVLDRVVLNAGMVSLGAQTSPSGLDRMFHVNFLGHVQLVEGLLAAGRITREGGRIVAVSSEAHRSGHPDLAHFGEPGSYGVREVMDHYGTSKLYLTTWLHALAADLPPEEIGVFALCPGAVDSDIARQAPGWMRAVLKPTMRLFFQSPYDAAAPVEWLATAAELDGVSGRYLHMHTDKPAAPYATAADSQRAVREAAIALIEEIT